MAKNDSDVIERALDSAEELLEERAQTEEADEAPEKSAAPATEEPIAQEADEEPTKEQSQDAEPATTEPVAEPTAQPEQPTFEAPKFWAAEKKAIFAKAPREVQQAVLEYEQARTEWASRLATESARGREYEEKVNKTFEPYAEMLQRSEIKDPIEAVGQLLEWNRVFEENPMAGVMELMRDNGITLQDLHHAVTNGGFQEPSPIDPRVEQALNEAKEAKQLAEQQVNWVQQQQQRYFQSEVTRFKEGKDSTGTPRKQFAELYAPQISQMAEAIQRQNPNVQLYDALEHAYETVLTQARSAFGVKPAQPVSAEKAVAAASNVKGAPVNGVANRKPKAKTIDEALDMAEEQLGIR